MTGWLRRFACWLWRRASSPNLLGEAVHFVCDATRGGGRVACESLCLLDTGERGPEFTTTFVHEGDLHDDVDVARAEQQRRL